MRFGEYILETHCKFANDLYVAVLRPGDGAAGLTDEKIEEILAITQRMANLMLALDTIDIVMSAYIKKRGLLG